MLTGPLHHLDKVNETENYLVNHTKYIGRLENTMLGEEAESLQSLTFCERLKKGLI